MFTINMQKEIVDFFRFYTSANAIHVHEWLQLIRGFILYELFWFILTEEKDTNMKLNEPQGDDVFLRL